MATRLLKLFICLALAATSAPLLAGEAQSPLTISSARYSWGNPVEMWMVAESGLGKYTNFERGPDGPKATTYLFKVTSARFAQLTASLKPAKRWLDRKIPCGEGPIMDAPRANVAFDRGGKTQKVNMDYGCRSKTAGKVLVAVGKANQLIRDWAKTGKEVPYDYPVR